MLIKFLLDLLLDLEGSKVRKIQRLRREGIR